MNEVGEKVARLTRLAESHGVSGVLITRQSNFAWLTGGESNRIDGSSDLGSGSLFVASDGRTFVVANRIEMPRLREEALRSANFEPLEYPWVDDHAEPATAAMLAHRAVGGRPIGADVAVSGVVDLEAAIAAARTPLIAEEIERYQRFGRDLGAAVGEACRERRPGETEVDVAVAINHAAGSVGARAIVTLVGADERIARFRHPVPGMTAWRNSLLIGLCAERHGLVVALSRIVVAGPPSPDLASRTGAAARVFAALLDATRSGATGAQLFSVATKAYAEVGFPDEEALHHQGGAIGYRSRDWIAHPGSCDVVTAPQAFAWNPSIAGTKVEDTALVIGDSTVLISASPDWPTIDVETPSHTIRATGILRVA